MLTPRIFTALALAVLSTVTPSIGSDATALSGAVHAQGQIAAQTVASHINHFHSRKSGSGGTPGELE